MSEVLVQKSKAESIFMDHQHHSRNPETRKNQPVEFVDTAEQTLHEKSFKLIWYYQTSLLRKIGKKKA